MPRVGREVEQAGIVLQEQLSEFLNAELLHTLGVYRHACEKLQRLSEQLHRQEKQGGESESERQLRMAAESSLYCNEQLRDHLHRAEPRSPDSPSAGRRPSPFRPGEVPPRPTPAVLEPIAEFYGDMAAALRRHIDHPTGTVAADVSAVEKLGTNFAFVHDPQRRERGGSEDRFRELTEGRIDRCLARYSKVAGLMQGGRAVAHGRTSGARLQRSLNDARRGSYVLRIRGQGGKRIQIR